MRIPEMDKFFEELLSENKNVYSRKIELLKIGRTLSEFVSASVQTLCDELAYMKTEQAFREIYSSQRIANVGPVFGEGHELVAAPFDHPQSGEINLGGYFFGSEWHAAEWEQTRNTAFRWTDGPRGRLRVAMSRARSLWLEFSCLYLAPGVSENGVVIQVDGEAVPTELVRSPSAMTYRAHLSVSDDRRDEHEIAILCPTSARPSSSIEGSGDNRLLGIAVSLFRFYPASDELRHGGLD